MEPKLSPYEPITPALAGSGLLITLKNAAVLAGACEGTLKDNAKARRLRAYQAHFGAPVMVLPNDLDEFLKSRPDIASNYHPKVSPAVPSSGHPTAQSIPRSYSIYPFPGDDSSCGAVGDFGIGITLRALAHTTPTERALVAKTLFEIARAINETVPADSGNQP